MSVAEQLVEITRDLVLDTIKAEVSGALAVVRADRADPQVTTEPPRKFFIYGPAQAYECPAVFVVVDSMDVRDEQDGPNFISASVKMFVSVVVEDREATYTTIKSERYQAALFRMLHRRHLQSLDGHLKIYSRVVRAEFSPLFTKDAAKPGSASFRKEVSIELDVRHFENPS